MCKTLRANYKGSSAEARTPASIRDSLSLAAVGWAKNSVMGWSSTLFHKPGCTKSMCAKEKSASDCTQQNRPSVQYLKHNHLPAICGVFQGASGGATAHHTWSFIGRVLGSLMPHHFKADELLITYRCIVVHVGLLCPVEAVAPGAYPDREYWGSLLVATTLPVGVTMRGGCSMPGMRCTLSLKQVHLCPSSSILRGGPGHLGSWGLGSLWCTKKGGTSKVNASSCRYLMAANGLRTESGFKLYIPCKRLGIIFDVLRLKNCKDVTILCHLASRIIGIYCHYWLAVGQVSFGGINPFIEDAKQ